jgi:uncharacterized membrane protein
MYCSSCGVAVAQNLTYCNFCGAKLNDEKSDGRDKGTQLRYESFVMVMIVGLFVFGLVAISMFAGVMKVMLNFDYGPLVAFASLSFLIMIALEGVLISRLFSRKHKTDNLPGKSSTAFHITKELEAQSRLTAEPVSSVTDHTTRTLDPVYSERK